MAGDEESAEIIEVGEGPSVPLPRQERVEHHPAAIQQEAAYGIKVWVERPYDEALAAVKRALGREGFEIVIETDIRQLLHEKLGTEFRQYTILGALNPDWARRALDLDIDLGLLLPLNMVVYETTGGTIVEAIDSMAYFAITDSADLADMAREAKQKLQDVVDHVAAGLA